MRKLEDTVLYSDADYHAAFPSIVSLSDGELLVSFRRALDRRKFFAPQCTHSDPNSQLMLVRSHDLGCTWTDEPELIHAHPFGGAQDACMAQLDDGSLLLTSCAWMLLPEEGIAHITSEKRIPKYGWTFTFLGGYLMRSGDRGHSWEGPILPPQIAGEATFFPGIPVPATNFGAMLQGRDGNLYWVAVRFPEGRPSPSVLDLLISRDRGLTWEHAGPVASDDTVGFNETSLVETPNGDLVAFVRTENFDDHGVVVRSRDHGKTWEPWQDMGVIGHPYHALPLPDGRVYLLYGYRHEPYGIRARILDPECTDFSGEEIVLRDDGGTRDLGYPWSCLTADGRILSVYYFNRNDGARHIAGTFLEIE